MARGFKIGPYGVEGVNLTPLQLYKCYKNQLDYDQGYIWGRSRNLGRSISKNFQ